MRLFWKINIALCVGVFALFMLLSLNMLFWNIHFRYLDIIEIVFLYGPFLELLQIPVALAGIFFTPRDLRKGKWGVMAMMALFFILKAGLYFLILSGGIPRH